MRLRKERIKTEIRLCTEETHNRKSWFHVGLVPFTGTVVDLTLWSLRVTYVVVVLLTEDPTSSARTTEKQNNQTPSSNLSDQLAGNWQYNIIKKEKGNKTNVWIFLRCFWDLNSLTTFCWILKHEEQNMLNILNTNAINTA